MNIKRGILFFLTAVLLANSCASLNKKVVFQPEPGQEQPPLPESGRIIESQNAFIPEWVTAFLNGGVRQVESLDFSKNRYVFIGKNRGRNFSALSQWAGSFNAVQDFPRLVAERIEKRLLSGVALYPDDEYGEYFEALVKSASVAEYPPAFKEETFWIKRHAESAGNSADSEAENASRDTYEFFILFTIDKNILQSRITGLLANVETADRPTRAQKSAINRVRQNFFEGF